MEADNPPRKAEPEGQGIARRLHSAARFKKQLHVEGDRRAPEFADRGGEGEGGRFGGEAREGAPGAAHGQGHRQTQGIPRQSPRLRGERGDMRREELLLQDGQGRHRDVPEGGLLFRPREQHARRLQRSAHGQQGFDRRLLRRPGAQRLLRIHTGDRGFSRKLRILPQEAVRRRGLRVAFKLPVPERARHRELRKIRHVEAGRVRQKLRLLQVRRRPPIGLPQRQNSEGGKLLQRQAPQGQKQQILHRRQLPQVQIQSAVLRSGQKQEGVRQGFRSQRGTVSVQERGQGEPPVGKGHRDEGQQKLASRRRVRGHQAGHGLRKDKEEGAGKGIR